MTKPSVEANGEEVKEEAEEAEQGVKLEPAKVDTTHVTEKGNAIRKKKQ